MCVWCVWTSALRGWGQSVWWAAFGFVRRATRLQRLAIGVTVRSAGPSGWTLFPTMPQGSEAHPSAIRGNLYEPRSRYTMCDAVVLPEGPLRRCRRPWNHHVDLPFQNWFWKTQFNLVLERASTFLYPHATVQCGLLAGEGTGARAASTGSVRRPMAPNRAPPQASPPTSTCRSTAAALQPPNRTLLF